MMIDFFKEKIDSLIGFMNTDVYVFFTDILTVFVEYFVIASLEFKMLVITVSWTVAQNLLVNLGLSDLINSSWSSLDSILLSYLTFFRIPEAFNILMQASVTRFVLRLF